MRRRHLALLIALVGIASSMYLVTAFTADDGRPVAPLDDAYITYQYARQIARGYPYQYNDGDPPTTGMTSPLFGFLLAGAYLLGFTGQRLVAVSVGMGIIWLGLTAWLTYRLASRLLPIDPPQGGVPTDHFDWAQYKRQAQRDGLSKSSEGACAGVGSHEIWPLVAAVLVILSGAVQWGFFNGMETGLFTVLTLAALDAFLAERTGLCALWLGLAGLTRPEGLILAGTIWAITLVRGIHHSRASRQHSYWSRLGLLSAAIVAAVAPLLVNWSLTGTTAAAGLQAKSHWFNVPHYLWPIVRSVFVSFWRTILPRFLGWDSRARWFLSPGLFLFSLLGWGTLRTLRRRTTLSVTLLWFLLGTLSTATLITATWHLGRYQVPFVPVLVALAVCGLAYMQQRARQRWQQALLGLAVLVFVTCSGYSALRYARSYQQAVSTMVHQQLVIADWIRKNLPTDVRVGVHDTGSLRYLAQRQTYDLIGLTTRDAAIAWRHGAGSVLELMERSPMRPDYFAIYPDVFFIPYLAETDLFAEELFRVEVPDYYGVTSAGPVQGVWQADWRLANSGEQFYQPDARELTGGMRLVDMLDVADLDDEAAHNMEWWHDVYHPSWPTEAQQLSYRGLPDQKVLDGGRLLTGGMSFEVSTQPEEPLRIIARLHAREEGAVRVEVNGQDVGRWSYPPLPGQWLETVFWVPSEKITDSRTRFVLRVDAPNASFRHYAPYYFWVMQGEVGIEQRVEVRFDEELYLLGFDLPGQRWHPGDTVPVTLYWQTAAPTQSDAKVFLHLYDAEGELGPQSDGWAFHGIRPPYTWYPGEVVVDPREITLPADLQPGPHTLEVGLYWPDGSGRLPAYRNGIRQHDDRVPLQAIEVTE